MTAERDRELRHIASVAAQAAAELVSTEATQQTRSVEVAANAARALAEKTQQDVAYIRRDMDEIKEKLDTRYVTVEAFEPIRRLVYGYVAIVLVTVVGAVVALIIRKP